MSMSTVRAVHTFVAEHGDELEFSAGEEIEVLERDEAFGDGWWRGRNTKGEEGLFPATYISGSPPTPEISNDHPIPHDAVPSPPRLQPQPPSPVATPSQHLAIPIASPDQISTKSQVSERFLTAPVPPVTEISPRSGTTEHFQDSERFQDNTESQRAGAPDTFFDTAAATVGAAATGVTNVMGKTIGEIQDAIESITKPESDDERELGIGMDTRARLAAQAKLANEQREKTQRTNGGVTGLVYSDESDDEQEDHRQSLVQSLTSTNGLEPAAPPVMAPLPPTTTNHERSLEPALPLPATPPLGQSEISGKPPVSWSLNDVVDWAKGKGFDESVCQRFREHEITGDLLLELDANLLKELDIPQFGKRLRIAQAISDLRRPPSTLSSSSQQPSPGMPVNDSSAMSTRGMSAPPSAITPFPSTTPPLTAPITPDSDVMNHAVWSHGRKTSSTPATLAPSMEAIRETQQMAPTPTATNSISTAASMPASPVTPSSTTKRESTGSIGHKKGKPSIDKQDKLSFFSRNRKPAPTALSPGGALTPAASTIRVHQMQPASPEQMRRPSTTAAPGTAKALRQIGTPDYSGYLKKKGDRYGSWKTQYFVLKGPHLYYLKSETEDRVKGHVDLRGHRVIVDENTNPGSYGFRLIGPDKPHAFSSSEQMVIRSWMKALMKATIARDYSVPVTSSCNIPTIPLAEAQALAPRPPSPATREATQRATRRENTNQLTAHDASVLMSLDTSSGQRRRESQNLSAPSRPTRDTRRPSTDMPRPRVAPIYPDSSDSHVDLVRWVNSLLPSAYPRATSFPQSFVSGEVIFLVVRSLSGIEPNPPVPSNAFAPERDGLPGLSGLFSTMDILIDAGIDTVGVSINDIRLGDQDGLSRLLESVKQWANHSAGVAH